jgi:peptidoglycan/LPS O-acetylase OafA/YrhL
LIWIVDAARAANLCTLGTLRAFLAVPVIIEHFAFLARPFQPVLMPIEPGGMAVLTFFFISGLVIVEAARRV